MRKAIGQALMMVLAVEAYGQSILDQADFKRAQFAGIHVYSTSVFGGYYSSAYPLTRGGFTPGSQPGLSSLGSEVNYGASATLGWQRHRARTDATVMYTGSYSGMTKYSELSGYNQSASIELSRELTRRWQVTLSGFGFDKTMAEAAFEPNRLAVLATTPGTVDDLATVIALFHLTDQEVAAMLTGISPAQSVLLGDRVRAYSVRAGATYTRSSRFSMEVSSFAAGGQHISGDQAAKSNYAMPHSKAATGGVFLHYAVSPRTEFGLALNGSDTINRLQTAYTGDASVSIARKMGPHWFARAYGGKSYTQITRHVYDVPHSTMTIGGGSLGYRSFEHTFLASYDRSNRDTFGFAAGMVTSASGAWSWNRPGSARTFFAGVSMEQMRNTGFVSLSGWQATSGITQKLNNRTAVTVDYAYLKTGGTYAKVANNLSVNSLRLTLRWVPEPVQ